MTDKTVLHDRITSGVASDTELEEYFGPDLMNQLHAAFTPEDELKTRFLDWYHAVLEPLGIEAKPAFAMYTGTVTIEEFAAGLTDEQCDAFINRYEDLQRNYMDTLPN